MPEQERAETTADEDDGRVEDEHLADVEDGCGCTEVWEHLSDNRSDD